MSDVPRFDVRYDRPARLLRWTMRGFWTMGDVAAFAAALRRAVEPLGPPPQRYDGICDARDFPVQSVEVSNALGEIDRVGAAMRDGPVAIVVGSVINKMQAQRTLTTGEVQVFLAVEQAEAWLSRSGETEKP